MGRVLALDYGEKKIGIAMSDKTRTIATSKEYIHNNPQFFDNLKKFISENEVDEIILGLPLKLNGEDSEQTVRVRNFKELLDKNLGMVSTLVDERLTTSYAEKLMISGNVRRDKRKQKIDSLSAQIFLQNYLDKCQKQ